MMRVQISLTSGIVSGLRLHVAPIAFVIAGSGESGRGRQQAENPRGFELLGDEPASRHV
jgi:hypothetical protein